jgi:hypothetical protein
VATAKRDSERAPDSWANLEAHFPQSLYPESGGRMRNAFRGVKAVGTRPPIVRREIPRLRARFACAPLGMTTVRDFASTPLAMTYTVATLSLRGEQSRDVRAPLVAQESPTQPPRPRA